MLRSLPFPHSANGSGGSPPAPIPPDEIAIHATLPELARVAAWADAVAARRSLSATMSFAIQLCLEEAVSNIIRHAFIEQADPHAVNDEVRLTLQQREDMVVATVEDFGMPFDPRSVPAPKAPASLDDAVVGGQGIHLMRRFAQAIDYERRGDMNRLTLFFAPQSTKT